MNTLAVKDSEEKIGQLTLLLNNISHAVLYESLQNQILFINRNFCELFNIPVVPELLYGADCSRAAEQSANLFMDPGAFVNGIRKVYENGVAIDNEELVLADGRSIYRDYKPISPETGHSGHLWIYKHSQELRSILKEVHAQKNFYEKLLNNIPADIAIFNNRHQYVFINKIAIANQETREWLIGKDDFDYCAAKNKSTELAVRRREVFSETVRTGDVVEFEEENRSVEGKKVHNLRRFYPLKEDDGGVQYVIGYGINITRIRERENQLKQREQAFRDLVDSMDQLAVVVDESGSIVYANPRWCSLLWRSKTGGTGKKIVSYLKKGKEVFTQQLQLFFEKPMQQYRDVRVSVLAADGREHILSYSMASFTHRQEEDKRLAVFFTDITQQIKAEKELIKIAKEERKLNQLKSNFLSMVSHELRTPLSVIMSSAELLEMFSTDGSNAKAIGTYTNRIVQQVDKMTQLISEFLFLSKVEAGKVPYNPRSLRPVDFVEKMLNEQFRPWKDGRMVGFSVKGSCDELMADELMITHTISNLLSNAFKYSPGAPPPQMRLCFYKKSWQVLIVDRGIGMQTGQLKKLFQPFVRGTNVGDIEGSGFGLNIVKIFVKMHKGKIRVRSSEDKGTAVLVQFPM